MNQVELHHADMGFGYGLVCAQAAGQGKPLPHEVVDRFALYDLLKDRLVELELSMADESEHSFNRSLIDKRVHLGLKKMISYLESPIVCNGKGLYLACTCPKFEAWGQQYLDLKNVTKVCESCLVMRCEDSPTRILRSMHVDPVECNCIVCMAYSGDFYLGIETECECEYPRRNLPIEKLCSPCLIDFGMARFTH
jgi:hypothetical protein